MPTYDYRCEKGHRYELRQPFGSPSEHPCEKCGKTATRQLSVPSLAFKGSGFYITDSRNRSGDDSSKSSKSSDSSSSSSSSD